MRQIVFLKNPLGLKVSYKNKTLRQTLVKKLECNLVTWSLRQFSLYNTVSVIPAVWWMIDWSRSSKTSASINLYHRLGFIIASFRVTSHSYHHVTYLFKTNLFDVWRVFHWFHLGLLDPIGGSDQTYLLVELYNTRTWILLGNFVQIVSEVDDMKNLVCDPILMFSMLSCRSLPSLQQELLTIQDLRDDGVSHFTNDTRKTSRKCWPILGVVWRFLRSWNVIIGSYKVNRWERHQVVSTNYLRDQLSDH